MASPVKEPAPRPKIFNDPIHGHIELHPLCVKVIDTPQFQRLKDLKQVGGVYSVFPGAAHNRFEHCIGTAFMATTMVEHLCTKQPKLFITEQEVLCVALAGLCHDLGHGILSHAFDLIFIPRMNPDTKWQHEHASVAMLDHLIQSNDLMPVFERYGLDWDHVHFIQELILGDESDAPPGFEWRGRPGKQFLYEIVANKRNGIDVDKFDYFARDCHHLGMKWSFDALRLIKFSRVMPVEGVPQVCYHMKEVWNIYELFHTRYNLHKRAYQHRVVRVVERMLCEVLCLADPFLTVTDSAGRPVRISQSVHDMVAYTAVSDYLFKVIEHSPNPALQPAKDLLRLVHRRTLYPFIGEALVSPYRRLSKADANELARRIVELASSKPGERAPLSPVAERSELTDALTPASVHGGAGDSLAAAEAAAQEAVEDALLVPLTQEAPDAAPADAPHAPTSPSPRKRLRSAEVTPASPGSSASGKRARRGQHTATPDSQGLRTTVAMLSQQTNSSVRVHDMHPDELELADSDAAVEVQANDVMLELVEISYGKKQQDPVQCVGFYARETDAEAGHISSSQVSCFIPHVFQEQYIRVYSRNRSPQTCGRIFKSFTKLCKREENLAGPSTPVKPPSQARAGQPSSAGAAAGREGGIARVARNIAPSML